MRKWELAVFRIASERLAVSVDDFEAARQAFHGPGRREAAVGHCARLQQRGRRPKPTPPYWTRRAVSAAAEAEDGFTERIQAMIFHRSSSLFTTLPMAGIGPTTFSEPLRL